MPKAGGNRQLGEYRYAGNSSMSHLSAAVLDSMPPAGAIAGAAADVRTLHDAAPARGGAGSGTRPADVAEGQGLR